VTCKVSSGKIARSISGREKKVETGGIKAIRHKTEWRVK
jgi:hypothetical protein